MLKKAFIILVVIVFAVGCRRDPRPRKAISEKNFIEVLIDVHISEAFYDNRRSLKLDSLQSDQLYQDVLKKHKITHEEMLATTVYYSRNPKEYDKVLTEVTSKLKQKNEELNLKEELILE